MEQSKLLKTPLTKALDINATTIINSNKAAVYKFFLIIGIIFLLRLVNFLRELVSKLLINLSIASPQIQKAAQYIETGAVKIKNEIKNVKKFSRVSVEPSSTIM